MGKILNTELPAPMSNTTMIFVCIFLLFWFLKAFRRFARMVLLRRSLLFGNAVQIQGLSSYLAYFDGATRSHLNSIVETRQSKPAVPMDLLYISCSFDSIQLLPSANPDIVLLSIKMKVTMPGKMYLLSNFDSEMFKKTVHQECVAQQQPTYYKYGHSGNRDIGIVFRETIFAGDRHSVHASSACGLVTLPFLSNNEICQNEAYMHELDTVGAHTINVAVKSPFEVNAEDKRYLFI